jgi:hypothetical protein
VDFSSMMNILWLAVAAAIFLIIALSVRAGWLAGRRRLAIHGEGANDGLGSAEAAIFAMMGLLLAFTFTGAANRFEHRRALIVQESNAIGTTWLRLDLLRDAARAEGRALVRRYLESRLEAYRNVTDPVRTAAALQEVTRAQQQLWDFAIREVKEDKTQPLAQLLLPALNETFDIGSARVLATRQHTHFAIFAMLGLLVLISAFLAGFGQAKVARQSMLHLMGFAGVTALALYLIVDLEYPRLGIIRVDDFDQALVELLGGLKS